MKPSYGEVEFISIDELSTSSVFVRENQIDYIFLMVKQAAITEELILQIQSLMSANTYVICFQNGIGHERKLSDFIEEERILLAVTTEGAKRMNATTVAHTGRGITYIGGLDSHNGILAHSQHLLLGQLLRTSRIPNRFVEKYGSKGVVQASDQCSD